ncbi:MAG: glycosyltransferase [Xenococcaceae cyanobacterium MO_167.B27]|nr:glycosyltransferase [Xenococcaceae cyanobacterium MO_167.B27]
MKYQKKLLTHILLLSVWIIMGAILRISNLDLKPPWSDEWATLVFSLGNSFRTIPLDEIISVDTLLSPLQLHSNNTVQDVVHNLLTESTHPPLYFILTHSWLKFLGTSGELVSIWLGRFLSTLLGVLGIPAIFSLSCLLFRSAITAHITAILIAVSPWHIYLSQEARHYTLAMLWIMASLGCLNFTITCLKQHKRIPFTLVIAWIIVNSCGVATHYFLGLTLVAETIVLSGYWLQEFLKDKSNIFKLFWQRIYLAILGTFIGCSVWFFTWRSIPDNQLTSWIFEDNIWLEFYKPLARLWIWIVTMFTLLPVEGVAEVVAIISGAIILVVVGWMTPKLIKGFKAYSNNLQFTILSRFVISAIALILTLTYIFGADLTLSARFQFIYFPGIILLVGAILGKSQEKIAVIICLLMGLCGSLTVINNYGFQKVERPDLVVPIIVEANSNITKQTPVIIATRHKSHGQTGEMMSVAWQFQELVKQNKLTFQPQFLLAHQEGEDETMSDHTLQQTISSLSSPFQLWLVNFSAPGLSAQNCLEDEQYQGRVTGYKYKLYHCEANTNS